MKFTVLMPVHDGIPYDLLKKATDSVLHNTLTPDEFIIIADGSISQKKKNFLIVKKKKIYLLNLFLKKKLVFLIF
jgi:glycosyltransferase involved in cell wall biosynthesis